MTMAALTRNYRFLCDDLAMTDGERVWGVPRAIQFDPPEKDVPFPKWLEDAPLDHQTYGPTGPEDEDWRPLYCPPEDVLLADIPASAVTVICLQRGEATHLTKISGAEALAEILHSAQPPERALDLGQLATGGGYHLVWREPAEALSVLEAAEERAHDR